jgi:cytochrome c
MRKTLLLAVFAAIGALVSSSNAFSADKATPEEVIAKVQQAVKLIEEKGDAAYPMIRDKNGPFIWKDTYVFVGDLDGNLLVHINSKLEGKNMMGAKDASGKLFHAELINGLKKKPDGYWNEYQWVKPGEKDPSQKVSYQVVVPNKPIFAGAGVWDITLDQVKQAKQ